MMRSWERALGKGSIYQDNQFLIQLEGSKVVFVEDTDGRGEGIDAFEINVNDKEKVLESAKSKGLIRNGEVYIGGVKFLLN
jgi:hypothetical protein